MYSTQAWAAHYGLPLNTPDEFVQGYADGMRLDAKGQGKPCGRGFIAPGKKCSAKGRQQLAQDLKAGDAKAKARVATGKQNAMAQQKARRAETQKNAERSAASKGKKSGKPHWTKAIQEEGYKPPGPKKDPNAYVSEFEGQPSPFPTRKRTAKAATETKPRRSKSKPDPSPKQQYKQATSAVRELQMRGVSGAPLRQAKARVKRLEKKFRPQ